MNCSRFLSIARQYVNGRTPRSRRSNRVDVVLTSGVTSRRRGLTLCRPHVNSRPIPPRPIPHRSIDPKTTSHTQDRTQDRPQIDPKLIPDRPRIHPKSSRIDLRMSLEPTRCRPPDRSDPHAPRPQKRAHTHFRRRANFADVVLRRRGRPRWRRGRGFRIALAINHVHRPDLSVAHRLFAVCGCGGWRWPRWGAAATSASLWSGERPIKASEG